MTCDGRVVALAMGMLELDTHTLAGVVGGQLADTCPVTNNTSFAASIYSPGARRFTDVGPGQTAAIPAERSVFYGYANGQATNVEGCKAGRAFQIVPNAPYYSDQGRVERLP